MLLVALESKRKTHEVVRECLATVQQVEKSASTLAAATDHDLTGSASAKLATMTTASSLACSTSTLLQPLKATITNPVAATEHSLMAHTKCSMPGSYNASFFGVHSLPGSCSDHPHRHHRLPDCHTFQVFDARQCQARGCVHWLQQPTCHDGCKCIWCYAMLQGSQPPVHCLLLARAKWSVYGYCSHYICLRKLLCRTVAHLAELG